MGDMPPPAPDRSNRFARELEDILQARGKRLTDLYHAGIYREQVRRLRRSLREIGRFPLLGLAEIDRIILHYNLEADEILRLRAALVATAVERMLFSRQIPAKAALQATEEVFDIVSRAMRDSQLVDVRGDLDQSSSGPKERTAVASEVTAVEQGAAPDAQSSEFIEEELYEDLSELMDDALDRLDRATLALHLSTLSRSRRDRIHCLQEAEQDYMTALEVCSAATGDPVAALWSAPIQQGLNEVQAQLRALG